MESKLFSFLYCICKLKEKRKQQEIIIKKKTKVSNKNFKTNDESVRGQANWKPTHKPQTTECNKIKRKTFKLNQL